ncbi:serine hydrolase [Humibacter sp. RRB41]|uniref:serine hydrolase domain-containing protein n=1 Tax=Humibacter sp. RRB41 TaxID=2919946 RepID=UPI001FAA9773|nr:serine hydrolase domain-containing protein [Humibacter sp. RRB41]
MAHRTLLPRSSPAAVGVSSRAIGALLDRLGERSIECHSLMVVRGGRVIAEGWWAPYSAERPHLLYSLTKSFTSIAVGLAVADGVLSLEDRVVDLLPDHVPGDVSDQGRRITVHHLLSMTAGHPTDSLEEAWQLEPNDLVKGFLRMPVATAEGTRHTYDNATTFILARMVERATGRNLPEFLDERLFHPMGIEDAEWDRVGNGAAFGFHGLHLRSEAVAAFGELLLRGGRWGDQQLVPRDWVELATSKRIDSRHYAEGADGADFLCGYGYQFWMSRHGFHGSGAFGQHCVVVPTHDLVVVVTSAQREVRQAQDVLDAIWECLLPGIEHADSARDDGSLAVRMRSLCLPLVQGSAGPLRSFAARLDASAQDSALPDGTPVLLEHIDGGWLLRFEGLFAVEIGHERWRESSPLSRPVCASGGWRGDVFAADLYIITSPHHVRLVLDADAQTAVATWTTVPLTGPDLLVHLRSPLMTRPDVELSAVGPQPPTLVYTSAFGGPRRPYES